MFTHTTLPMTYRRNTLTLTIFETEESWEVSCEHAGHCWSIIRKAECGGDGHVLDVFVTIGNDWQERLVDSMDRDTVLWYRHLFCNDLDMWEMTDELKKRMEEHALTDALSAIDAEWYEASILAEECYFTEGR